MTYLNTAYAVTDETVDPVSIRPSRLLKRALRIVAAEHGSNVNRYTLALIENDPAVATKVAQLLAERSAS